MVDEHINSDRFASDLLGRLSSTRPEAAWKQFIDTYSPAILAIVHQHALHGEQRNDCYLYVCEKLCDNGFRRLRRFRLNGPASFKSWLSVVVANLCIDWRRHEFGRLRPFQSIRKMPVLERLAFKYRFQQGLGLEACLGCIRASIPGLTEPQLAGAISRINEVLTPRQHSLLRTRRRQTVSLDVLEIEGATGYPKHPGPGPEAQAEVREQIMELKKAMRQLAPEQRLLLQLRYAQDLTYKEIARLMRLGDPFRVRRLVQRALEDLSHLIKL